MDVGDKNIGVAISDQGLKFANPLSIIKRNKLKLTSQKLISIIKNEEIGGLVLGWPINMNGTQGPRCDSTRDFAHAILKIYDIPMLFIHVNFFVLG